jgi:hypothetical protein
MKRMEGLIVSRMIPGQIPNKIVKIANGSKI